MSKIKIVNKESVREKGKCSKTRLYDLNVPEYNGVLLHFE